MNTKIFLTALLVIFYGIGFSQSSFSSNEQELCDFTIKDKKTENCTAFDKDITITINEEKERIYIKKPLQTFIFKIVKKATNGDVTTFTTIRATGIRAIIEYDSSASKLIITDYNNKPITTRQTFYLN